MRQPASTASLRRALALGVLLAAAPAAAQAPVPSADKPATPQNQAAPPSCADCRAAEPRTAPSNTLVIEPDGKTIVKGPLMRQQSDFRLNNVLKNVSGITGR